MKFGIELREGIGISWMTIRANKMRTALTTLGIVIGIVTVTLMQTAIEGLNKAFLKSISAIGTDVLYIQRHSWFSDEPWWKVRNRRIITVDHAQEIARQSTLTRAVSCEAGEFGSVKYDGRSANSVMILGCWSETAIVANLSMTHGRFLSPNEIDGARPVCVVGAELAANLFPNEPPVGKKIRIEGMPYEVVGVVGKIGSFLGLFNFDNRVMIPITRFFGDIRNWPEVTVMAKVRDIREMNDCVEELRGIMRKARRLEPGMPDDFAINQQDAFIKTFNRLGASIAAAGLVVAGLALFVGGIGIMNIMFVSVAERTKEIGLRKALGARRRTILLQFLIEAAIICLCSGVLAIGLAYPLSKLIDRFLPTSMSLTVIAVALTVSLITGLVSGFLPAWRASRLSPVEALRNE